MKDTKEETNDFAGAPVENEAEKQPAPSEVAEAVKEALRQPSGDGVIQIDLNPCPCGTTAVNLMIDVAQGDKIGRASCGVCGAWGVDFLAPRTQNQNLTAKAAAKAWNEAPRITATDPA